MRIIVRQELNRADLVRAFRRCLLTACVLAAVMAAAAGLVVTNFASGGDAAAVAALALCLPLHAFAVVPTALLQKSMQFRRLAALNAIANVVSAVAAVLLALSGFGVWALVARQLVVFGMQAVLTPLLCIGALRDQPLTARTVVGRANPAMDSERWFFLFGVVVMVTANLDYLVIGGLGDAYVVGLYALAFTIAMAPSTHISEQVGRVLFAATALQPQNSRKRTEQSVRLMSMLFVPLLPVGILLAPTVLPAVLGDQWAADGGAVSAPAGRRRRARHRELHRGGAVRQRAHQVSGQGHGRPLRSDASGLLVLVPVDGIRGAALAQLIVFVPYAAVYVTAGARRAGTSATALGRQLRPVALALVAQLAVSGAVAVALAALAVSDAVISCAAAAAGLAICAPLLYWFGIRRLQR